MEREIRGGEAHSYPVDLQAGQLLRVVVQEKGSDLAMKLLDPTGKVVTGADSPRFEFDSREDLAAVAGASGPHRLEVTAPQKSPPASYALTVEAVQEAPQEQQRLRAEAVRFAWEAFHPAGEGGQEQTLLALERARELWARLQDRREEAEVLYLLGMVRHQLPGGAQQAADEFRQAAHLWSQITGPDARKWRSESLNSAGTQLVRLLQNDEARQLFQEAIQVAQEARDSAQEAIGLSNLGLLETNEGDLQKGTATLVRSLSKAREAGTLQPSALNNLGYAYEQLGQKQKALQYYQEAMDLARKLGAPAHQATALNNLGDTYSSLGDWERALRYFQQALEILGPLEDPRGEAILLTNLGITYQRLDRFEEASRAFDRALDLSRKSKDLETQTAALVYKAYLLMRQKRPAQALETARLALPGAEDFWATEADARQILGIAHRELGDLKASKDELARAVGLARSRGDVNREATYTLTLARTERARGDLRAALDLVRSATEMIESVRAQVVSPDLRAMFLASGQDYYELQIDTLMSLHAAHPQQAFAAEALVVSEQARARSLLEILQESEADIREGASAALIEKERRLREEVNAREWRRLGLLDRNQPDASLLAESERRLEEAREEYRKVQDELRTESPRYAALTQPRAVTEEEIRKQLLDGRALLLEYKLGKERSFLWAVSPDSVRSFELPKREAIETLARRWYELLTVRNHRLSGESLPAWKMRIQQADTEAGKVAHELSRMILQPVEGDLQERPLLIVADGALQYIPFSALPLSSGAPLVTRHEVVSLPSASTLALLRRDLRDRSPAPRLLAILADPVFQKDDARLAKPAAAAQSASLANAPSLRGSSIDTDSRETGTEPLSFRRLPYSLKEAQTIASFAPPEQTFVATGFGASRNVAISSELTQYRNVHFATHGLLDSRRPELSGLVFSLYNERGESQDGFLRLNDIYNLRLDADLVVLSACKTALGKEIRGEGLVGLTRGFMYAGAARVLASLWSVDDRPTADLMGSFYRGVLREELSPAAALRKAQLEMMQNPSRKSPYFWAGFTLQGEWR